MFEAEKLRLAREIAQMDKTVKEILEDLKTALQVLTDKRIRLAELYGETGLKKGEIYDALYQNYVGNWDLSVSQSKVKEIANFPNR